MIAGMDAFDELMEYAYGAAFAELDRELWAAADDRGAVRRLLAPFLPTELT